MLVSHPSCCSLDTIVRTSLPCSLPPSLVFHSSGFGDFALCLPPQTRHRMDTTLCLSAGVVRACKINHLRNAFSFAWRRSAKSAGTWLLSPLLFVCAVTAVLSKISLLTGELLDTTLCLPLRGRYSRHQDACKNNCWPPPVVSAGRPVDLCIESNALGVAQDWE